MTALVVRGDARSLPLPGASVDLVVTSPPYFQLRSYTDGGEHYPGQIGSESSPREYIDALLACTREWMRVLKPGGSIFVNLGDKYSNCANGGPFSSRSGRRDRAEALPPRRSTTSVARRKSLLLLPERYRIGCVDELGLIARAVVVWSKPNGLPESVKDRVRRSHEDWVHLTKEPVYYSAVDAIRRPHSKAWKAGANGGRRPGSQRTDGLNAGLVDADPHFLGALPGSVWEVATEPLTVPAELGVDHFAAYPTELVRRIVLGWSPSAICTACGHARRLVVSSTYESYRATGATGRPKKQDTTVHAGGWNGAGYPQTRRLVELTGQACACAEPTAPTRPSVVVDPFGGTGTTALVASVLGRVGVSVDRSGDYCRLAAWRTTDSDQRARAARVAKPDAQIDGQLDLLAEMAT